MSAGFVVGKILWVLLIMDGFTGRFRGMAPGLIGFLLIFAIRQPPGI